ncbi:Zinc finger, RING-type [Dillenia turbinata]|uniref:Zinc finger, RING-type n=1 Tax=Dillenia turbinata TaxID=194707 RepID=A0AAN8UWY9_9MAGN
MGIGDSYFEIVTLILYFCIWVPLVFIKKTFLSTIGFSSHASWNHSPESTGKDEAHKLLDLQVLKFQDCKLSSSNDDEGEKCSICLEEFGMEDEVSQLPKCDHVFHVQCVGQWFDWNQLMPCPLCRSHFLDEDNFKYVQICVEIGLSTALVPQIRNQKWVQHVEYQGLHLICFSYGQVGHSKNSVEMGAKSLLSSTTPQFQWPLVLKEFLKQRWDLGLGCNFSENQGRHSVDFTLADEDNSSPTLVSSLAKPAFTLVGRHRGPKPIETGNESQKSKRIHPGPSKLSVPLSCCQAELPCWDRVLKCSKPLARALGLRLNPLSDQ